MTTKQDPAAVAANDAPLRARPSVYPLLLASRVAGREKRPLGDLFGLTKFGVNLTRLRSGAASSLRHAHSRRDEFVFVLEGRPTLHANAGLQVLAPGMFAGFAAGTGDVHSLINETGEDIVYLEIGDRSDGDEVSYPDADLAAKLQDGRWRFFGKDGTPY